jgi:GTP cyclohydrolase I
MGSISVGIIYNIKKKRRKMDSNKIKQGTKLILEGIGEDISREGLVDTPDRVARMYSEICSGYSKDTSSILKKTFTEKHDEMIIVKDINYYSLCEHHMVPFFGRVHVGYIPKGQVLGLSKIARLVEIFARRLQLQERLTDQIADEIMKIVQPLGVMVVVEGQHLCMVMRGVKKINSSTTTSAVRGQFKQNKDQCRDEFLALIAREGK